MHGQPQILFSWPGAQDPNFLGLLLPRIHIPLNLLPSGSFGQSISQVISLSSCPGCSAVAIIVKKSYCRSQHKCAINDLHEHFINVHSPTILHLLPKSFFITAYYLFSLYYFKFLNHFFLDLLSYLLLCDSPHFLKCQESRS